MVQVILGIGSNLGDREGWLQQVRVEISDKLGEISLCSELVESAPWGYSSDHAYLNQVVLIECMLSAPDLLYRIHEIEATLGRVKKAYYVDRKVDIDILFYDDSVMESEQLTIPHPLIQDRLFVLIPLAQILPEYQHPVLKETSSELLRKCKDKSVCEFFRRSI